VIPSDLQDSLEHTMAWTEITRRRHLREGLRHIFADGGYAGDNLREALRRLGDWSIEIVKRSDSAAGFVVLPRRWVVERTFAWLGRYRRLAKDFEASIGSAVAWVLVANIRLLTRKLAAR
jgi:transposase